MDSIPQYTATTTYIHMLDKKLLGRVVRGNIADSYKRCTLLHIGKCKRLVRRLGSDIP